MNWNLIFKKLTLHTKSLNAARHRAKTYSHLSSGGQERHSVALLQTVRKHAQFVLIKAMGLGVNTKFNPSFLSLHFSQTVLTSDSVHLALVSGVSRASVAFQNTALFNLIIDGSAVTCRPTQPENSLQPQPNAGSHAVVS